MNIWLIGDISCQVQKPKQTTGKADLYPYRAQSPCRLITLCRFMGLWEHFTYVYHSVSFCIAAAIPSEIPRMVSFNDEAEY